MNKDIIQAKWDELKRVRGNVREYIERYILEAGEPEIETKKENQRETGRGSQHESGGERQRENDKEIDRKNNDKH